MDVWLGENGESMYLFLSYDTSVWFAILSTLTKKKLLISVTKQKEKREQYTSTVVEV